MPAAAIGIGAAMGLGGAAIQAHSASSAAKKQQESANQALALQRDIYNQNVQRVQPYVDAGYASLGNLMRQFGSGQDFSQQVAGQLAPFQGAIGLQARIPQGMPSPAPNQGMAPQMALGSGQPAGANVPLVMVQAPTGETRQVPLPMAQQLAARGARILGGVGGGGGSLAQLGPQAR